MKNQWEFLKRSAELGKLAHAYIFSGNDTPAKEEMAFSLAKLINCERKDTNGSFCGDCSPCRAVQGKRHPDVSFVQPVVAPEAVALRPELKISQIRSLASYLNLGAWTSPCKIAIIHKAHTMNLQAQSAFLKLLEEPKGSTLFLLLAEYPHMLLDTIRSRAQEIKFYNFAQSLQVPREIKDRFDSLRKATIHEKFTYAKQLSESPDQIETTLEGWLRHARTLLNAQVQKDAEGAAALLRAVQTIQDVLPILQYTNVNARLALERIMLEII